MATLWRLNSNNNFHWMENREGRKTLNVTCLRMPLNNCNISILRILPSFVFALFLQNPSGWRNLKFRVNMISSFNSLFFERFTFVLIFFLPIPMWRMSDSLLEHWRELCSIGMNILQILFSVLQSKEEVVQNWRGAIKKIVFYVQNQWFRMIFPLSGGRGQLFRNAHFYFFHFLVQFFVGNN